MARQLPGTSKQNKSSAFFAKKRMAEDKFGVASEKPQDHDAAFLRAARRTNFGMNPERPEKYKEILNDFANSLFNIPDVSLPEFKFETVTLQDENQQSSDLLQLLRPKSGEFQVLGVDFEFHNEYTYDGFICVGSVSSSKHTLVVDCLYKNRVYAKKWISKMMTGHRTLKVFLGCANDVFRLQKDWECFPVGAVDVQDLFLVWKERKFQDCFQTCKDVVRTRLNERGSNTSEENIQKYLHQLNMPGMSFLQQALLKRSPEDKDELATVADWRKRPLHSDLVRYLALDSYTTLQIFYYLYPKVGKEGVQKAITLTSVKLQNKSTLPRYKNNLISSAEDQWFVEQIYKWRDYLAKHLDAKPEQILASKTIPHVVSNIKSVDSVNGEEMSSIFKKCRVSEKFHKGANLLAAYVDRGGSQLEDMQKKLCHNCNTYGHIAKFCFSEPTREAKKGVMGRAEYSKFAQSQNERRRRNWCLKTNQDPSDPNANFPWEKSPKNN